MTRLILCTAFILSLPPYSHFIPPSSTPSHLKSLSPELYAVIESPFDSLKLPSSRLSSLLQSQKSATISLLPRRPNPVLPHHHPNSTYAAYLDSKPQPGIQFPLPLRTLSYKRLLKYHSKRFMRNVSSGITKLRKHIPCRVERVKVRVTKGKLSPRCDLTKHIVHGKLPIPLFRLPAPRPPPPTPSTYVYIPPTRASVAPPSGPVEMHILTITLLFGLYIAILPIALIRDRFSAGLTESNASQRNKGVSTAPGLRRFLFFRRGNIKYLLRASRPRTDSDKPRRMCRLRVVNSPRVFVYRPQDLVNRFPASTLHSVPQVPYLDTPCSPDLSLIARPLSNDSYVPPKSIIPREIPTPFQARPDLLVEPQPSQSSKHYKQCHAYAASSNTFRSLPAERKFNIQVDYFRTTQNSPEETGRRVYRWEEALGEGNFGVVSLYAVVAKHGEDSGSDAMPDKIAVKQVATSVDVEVGEEVAAMKRMEESKWVVGCLDCVRFGEGMHILMPYYVDGTLHGLLHDNPGGKLPRETAIYYIAELITATYELHKNGIIHRDIKPSNILLSPKGHIILGDLGLARVFPLPAISSDTFNPLLFPSSNRESPFTITGASGSVPFSAPEIMQHKPYTFGVDYYALAVVGHILLTGALPFRGTAQSIKENPEDYELRKLVLGKELDEVEREWFEKMLHQDPEQRVQNFEDIKDCEMFRDVDWSVIAAQSGPVPFFDKDDDGTGSEASFSSTRDDVFFD